jgi:hypothetical protein
MEPFASSDKSPTKAPECTSFFNYDEVNPECVEFLNEIKTPIVVISYIDINTDSNTL